jgi:hypothetical protein
MKIVVILVMFSLLSAVFVNMVNAYFTSVLEHKENFKLYRDTLLQPVGLNGSDIGYVLYAGETLFVSWKITEIFVPDPIVWLLSEQQRDHFSFIAGGPSIFYGYLLKTIGFQGNFTFAVQQNGTYYVVLHNIAWGALDLTGPILNVQVYEADLTVPTQITPTPRPTPQSQTVGGTSFRVYALRISNAETLTPWISLTSLIVVLALLVMHTRKRKRFSQSMRSQEKP